MDRWCLRISPVLSIPGFGRRCGCRPRLWRKLKLNLPLDHLQLELGDGFRRVEALRACLGAVHDGVAAIEPERVFKIVEPFAGGLVAWILDPARGLQQRGGPEEALAVPPIA